jgi:hypothetical protein
VLRRKLVGRRDLCYNEYDGPPTRLPVSAQPDKRITLKALYIRVGITTLVTFLAVLSTSFMFSAGMCRSNLVNHTHV